MVRRTFAWVLLLAAFVAFCPVLHTHPVGKPADVCGTCASGSSLLVPAGVAIEAPVVPSVFLIAAPESAPRSCFAPALSSRAPPAA